VFADTPESDFQVILEHDLKTPPVQWGLTTFKRLERPIGSSQAGSVGKIFFKRWPELVPVNDGRVKYSSQIRHRKLLKMPLPLPNPLSHPMPGSAFLA
jgi:hypothetical protein